MRLNYTIPPASARKAGCQLKLQERKRCGAHRRRLTLDIQTPLDKIPATLKVWQTETGLGGSVASEMGDANIVSAALVGNSFTATLSFAMGGQALEAKIAGEVDGTQMDGSISLQDSPELPFTGTKTS